MASFKNQTLFIFALMFAAVFAGQDYCIPNSDAICKRYGDDYCCAKIDITKNGVADSYHSCTTATNISLSGGKFNAGGYSGSWRCTGATKTLVGAALAMTLIMTSQ